MKEPADKARALMALIIIILVGIALYFTVFMNRVAVAPTDDNLSATTSLSSGTDTSDEALERDLAELEAQLNALENDSASVDAAVGEAQLIPN